MQLEDIMYYCDDNMTVVVTDGDRELARYDGRNSIPMELNGCKVKQLSVQDNALYIEVEV